MSSEIQAVQTWLSRVVIGLNLCPFAAYPYQKGRVRIIRSEAQSEEQLLEDLDAEFAYLNSNTPELVETTLIVVPHFLQDFFDYTQFIQWANSHLKREGWLGVFQLATFHPSYCFQGANEDDRENYTNRAPFPVIHIIREASLEKAIAHYDDVETVPERNKLRVEELTEEEIDDLFPSLK